nr:hypothetical protein [Spiroplasma culicicola]
MFFWLKKQVYSGNKSALVANENRIYLDKIAEDVFDNQCTGANPRYSLIEDLKQIYLDAYYGNVIIKFAK